MSETPKRIMLFPNGNSLVSNNNGEQIPELQESWFRMYFQFLIDKGIDIEAIEFNVCGSPVKIIPLGNGEYNWQFK